MAASAMEKATHNGRRFSAQPLSSRRSANSPQSAAVDATGTRLVMAGQWFVSQDKMHPLLGESNAGLDADLDALAAYLASLDPR